MQTIEYFILEFAKLSQTEEHTGGICTHLVYMTSFTIYCESGDILKINYSIDYQKKTIQLITKKNYSIGQKINYSIGR